jgi:hypothetical protein
MRVSLGHMSALVWVKQNREDSVVVGMIIRTKILTNVNIFSSNLFYIFNNDDAHEWFAYFRCTKVAGLCTVVLVVVFSFCVVQSPILSD